MNGIFDDEGNEIMRPWNEKEKEFMNKFYEETVNANFVANPELRRKRKELKQVQLKLAEINPKFTDNIRELSKVERKLDKEVTKLREEHLLYPDPKDHKKIYAEDYGNKMCILSDRKSKGCLLEHRDELYEEFYKRAAEFRDSEFVEEYHERDMLEREIDEY